jgi:hypothetical protein
VGVRGGLRSPKPNQVRAGECETAAAINDRRSVRQTNNTKLYEGEDVDVDVGVGVDVDIDETRIGRDSDRGRRAIRS